MALVFEKMERFFRSPRLFQSLGVIVFLLVFAYIEEDWRGSYQWQLAKADWEAKGESFDRSKFVPPPVPDEQNIAALPLFKLEEVSDKGDPSYPTAVTLRHAMREDLSQLEFPKIGNPLTGELPDMAALRKSMAANYALAFKGAKPPDDSLEQFNAVYPFFNDFVSAAQTRPLLRLTGDYLMAIPAARPLGPLVDLIKLSKILALHAVFAQNQLRSDLAFQDIKTNFKFASGAAQDPSMVGGLVSIGIVAINRAAIYNGLALHAWNEAQLVDLDSMLKSFNFLAVYQFDLRAQAASGAVMLDFLQHTNQIDLERGLGRSARESPLSQLVGYPWPSGWWDNNKKVEASFDLGGVAAVDSSAHLAFPKTADLLKTQYLSAKAAWDGWAPWNMVALISTESLMYSTPKFSQAQVSVDETRIACALERYRLAHGVYPATLAELVPACIDAVPHDIMNGEPYRYRLNADGTFLLYSVGWNQTDDGGTIAFKPGDAKAIDYENGDWVWPPAKAAH